MLPKFSYVRPSSIDQAVEALATDTARIHSGGTDLIGCLRDGTFPASVVVSLGGVDGLRGITPTADGGLRIGAMTTIAEIAAHALIQEKYTALAEAAAVVASPQLRNQGTIAGNLCQKPRCWYYRGDFDCLRKGGEMCYAYEGENQGHCIFGGNTCYIVHPSDTAPALVALGAIVRIAGNGSSRSLPVEKLHVPPSDDPQRELYLEPGEIITEIVLPPPTAGLKSSYRKVRSRATWDFALAGVALALVIDGDAVNNAQVVLSGAAPVPWRATKAEKSLKGSKLDQETIKKAAKAAMNGAEPLSQNGYKIPLFEGLIKEQLEALA
ncbi:MAG: xanthine dehydrogenase family protein subunit M [bacterium]|nr:xanthine dehydrogenase family protein subunit M [bacterium]